MHNDSVLVNTRVLYSFLMRASFFLASVAIAEISMQLMYRPKLTKLLCVVRECFDIDRISSSHT